MIPNKDYIGTVIYNEDPTFAGRCKVKVFGLFDDLSDDNIPWFVPSTTTIYSSEGGGNISIIGRDAFRGCSSLASIQVPSSVFNIGDGAFRGCSCLTSVQLP